MSKARYIMIGGFLGAGKTTAVLRLAEHLSAKGQKVGLITNDQSVGLVDTAMLSNHGFDVQEITGGCFCCRFNSLVDAADKLSADTQPDVFIAEPVGSCTDLKASVSYPLRRMYGDNFSIAPLSVLIDPIRAMRILGLEKGKAFSPKVLYVYNKQLEEAEQIVINKIDLLTADRLQQLRTALTQRYPKASIHEISARVGTGLEGWFDSISREQLGTDPTMEIDYDIYADGEALLGWVNATIWVSSSPAIDGNALVRRLADEIQRQLNADHAEIAHLKMTLSPDAPATDLAVLNIVRNDQSAEFSHKLAAPIESGELLINLRAEADPDILKAAVISVLGGLSRDGLMLTVGHLESFRPGRPQPTHRMAQA